MDARIVNPESNSDRKQLLEMVLPKHCLLSAIAFTVMCAASSVRAQWASDSVTNTPVCTAAGLQDRPAMCSDDSNGAIIAWEDARATGYRIYAQRLNASGHALWTANGIQLSSGSADQRNPILASDGRGGAYVVWEDYRNASNGIDLYAQHITSAGVLAYGSAGAAVCKDPRDQDHAAITSDGFGNCYVAWEDNRATLYTTQPDIYMNRLTPAGVQWTTDGLAISTQQGPQRRVQLCEDGFGGCYLAWQSSEVIPEAIFAQHVDSNGTLHWQQSAGGLNVFQASSGTENSSDVSICRDGNYLLLAWEMTDISAVNQQDIYANRVSASGSKYFYTPVAITGPWLGNQTNPRIFSDDSLEGGQWDVPGMMVLFDNDYGFVPPSVDLVRAFSDGSTDSAGFYQISYTNSSATGFKAVPVSPGSVLTAWDDSRGDTTVFAQRVDRDLRHYFPSMVSRSTWGLPLCHRTTASKQIVLAPRANGAIAAWTDYRNGNADIYAQLVFQDGTLPIELASFTLTAPQSGEVDVAWETANEQACAGFEIERREIGSTDSNNYTLVASYETSPGLRSSGNSNVPRYYLYRDRTAEPSIYEYRLVEISLDGSRTAFAPKLINAGQTMQAGTWELGNNRPNPFTASTEIPFTLATSAILHLTIYDVAGRAIVTPIEDKLFPAGTGQLTLNAGELGTSSGTFLVRMTAMDPETGMVLWQSTRPLLRSRLH